MIIICIGIKDNLNPVIIRGSGIMEKIRKGSDATDQKKNMQPHLYNGIGCSDAR